MDTQKKIIYAEMKKIARAEAIIRDANGPIEIYNQMGQGANCEVPFSVYNAMIAARTRQDQAEIAIRECQEKICNARGVMSVLVRKVPRYDRNIDGWRRKPEPHC